MDSTDQFASHSRVCRLTGRAMQVSGPVDVVVVDDNAPAADAVCVALAEEGYRPWRACSGPEAVTRCEQSHANLVLLDIDMPDVDGFTTAHELRARQATRTMVIIAFTGEALEQVTAHARPGDFDGYCRKGTDFRTLCRLLGACITGSSH